MTYPPPIDPAVFLDPSSAAPAASLPLARTPVGSPQRNRAVTPPGVTDVHLAAASAQSTAHADPSFTPPAGGTDDYHFAPENETVTLHYTLGARFARVTLEVFRPGEAAPIWSRRLTAAQRTSGAHQIPWNGSVPVSPQFPDGFVTAEHSPYKVKISIGGTARAAPREAWTYFHVLVHSIELELGDVASLSQQRDLDLHAALAPPAVATSRHDAIPAPGATREVRLVSNIFKGALPEMYDDTAFTLYQAMWGDGPNLPIFAIVWVKASDDTRVSSPKALGGVQFLWDFADVIEPAAGHAPQAATFLSSALDYDVNVTAPTGDNCHADRGGKRGPAPAAGASLPAGRLLFPPQAGYAPAATLTAGAFPFVVSTAALRPWAALSRAWTTGALAGKTGVMFQPSRMAGDAYSLTVHLAYQRTATGAPALDVATPGPLTSDVHRSTGTFQIWREVHLVRFHLKSATTPVPTLSALQSHYAQGHVRLVDKTTGPPGTMGPAATYNAAVASVRTNLLAGTDWPIGAAIDPAADHFSAGNYVIRFLEYPDFQTSVRALRSWSSGQFLGWATGAGSAFLGTMNYAQACTNAAPGLAMRLIMALGLPGTLGGINLIIFDGNSNLDSLADGLLDGIAPTTAPPRHDFATLLLFHSSTLAVAAGATLDLTTTHEIGHLLFLPHGVDNVPAAAQPSPESHDAARHDCLMSYNDAVTRSFCGLCLLRLRGWQKAALSTTASANHR